MKQVTTESLCDAKPVGRDEVMAGRSAGLENSGSDIRARIGLLLLPGYAIEEYALFAAALERINNKSQMPALRISVLSEQGGILSGNCGSFASTQAVDKGQADFDYFFIFGDSHVHIQRKSQLTAYLQRLRQRNCVIGAVGDAVLALEKMGLLQKEGLAIHWQRRSLYSELELTADASDRLCNIGPHQWTSCGQTSTLDLAIHLIAEIFDKSTAIELAQDFIHSRAYDIQATQTEEILSAAMTGSRVVNRAIELFRQNIEFPLTMQEVCKTIDISQRQLERQFTLFCSMSPSKFYREQRLARARELVLKSNLGLSEVAFVAGFQGIGALTPAYRRKYGRTPSYERRQMRFAAH